MFMGLEIIHPIQPKGISMTSRWTQILASLALLGCLSVQAQTTVIIYSPGALANTEGAADNTLPFSIAGLGSERYQQVYGAAGFGALPGSGGLITKIAFRMNGGG